MRPAEIPSFAQSDMPSLRGLALKSRNRPLKCRARRGYGSDADVLSLDARRVGQFLTVTACSHLRLTPGHAHCDLALATEARWCPLRFSTRG